MMEGLCLCVTFPVALRLLQRNSLARSRVCRRSFYCKINSSSILNYSQYFYDSCESSQLSNYFVGEFYVLNLLLQHFGSEVTSVLRYEIFRRNRSSFPASPFHQDMAIHSSPFL
jgi:hypothetical protein